MPKRGIISISLVALITIITFLAIRLQPINKINFPPLAPRLPAGRQEASSEEGCPDFTAQHLMLGAKEITVAVADSPAERMHGLSGCPQIPTNSGMYFVIHPVQPTTFWMKDMLIPLDIIWLKDNKVIGLNPSVPPPVAGSADASLPQYHAPSAVDAVLELPAGQAHSLDIKIGSTIKPT